MFKDYTKKLKYLTFYFPNKIYTLWVLYFMQFLLVLYFRTFCQNLKHCFAHIQYKDYC